MKILSGPTCVAKAGDVCGEGAVWHAPEAALYWTDINRFLIHRYDPRNHDVETWEFPEPVTAVNMTTRDDTLAVVLGSRVILWEPRTGREYPTAFQLAGWPHVRLNDARPDPRGSLWLGSMRNNVNPDRTTCSTGGTDGILYRLDPDGTISEWVSNLGVSNTVAWSPDRTCFYFGDSLANSVRCYDYDASDGSIRGERPFLEGFARGVPDGSTVDADGYLWNCRFYGGCIVRVAPDGTIDTVIQMPVQNVTTCTFGGENLTTLYVTTASAESRGEDLAGGLFAIETDVCGQPENRFSISPKALRGAS
ncbi:MAG TPA: SMP-30/gluconolactonase/LRE family protein [Acidobacteriaceae bacterium]